MLVLKAQYWPLCFARLRCCFGFHGSEASIVIKDFYSGKKQKPQNFQHHKNGRQEIAACNAQWAIRVFKNIKFPRGNYQADSSDT